MHEKDLASAYAASPNIAVVKYWGARNQRLNLPENGSVSLTLDESLSTITTVRFSPKIRKDVLILNGKEAEREELARVMKILGIVRKKAGIRHHALVASKNSFPTGAGIASSASGFAALACAASDAAGLRLSNRELSILARHGSGSACRSVLGGFVEWRKGALGDGSDSYAVQIAPAAHWPELRNIIAISDPGRKKIGSEEGMARTVKTSALFRERARQAPRTIVQMKRAIKEKNLGAFLGLAMRDSSNMHACMLDSYPPITYLNETSKRIMEEVHEFNHQKEKVCAGYTFDAGANAHVLTISKHDMEIEKLLSGIKGVRKTISAKVGKGPRRLSGKDGLV